MIRDGVEADFARCVELGFNFHQHAYGKEGVAYCTDSCLQTLAMAKGFGLFVVAEFDGVVQGFCIGVRSPMMMNHAVTVGAEMAWWVEPEYRGTSAGLGLLKAIEERARDEGVELWSMVLLDSVEPEKIDKIYRRMGYKPAEKVYLKRLS